MGKKLAVSLTSAPYYDDYDASKGYTQILAVPGRVEQAREFTQIQSIFRDLLARYGDALFSNGTIITGCSLIINDGVATITPGRIYIDGQIRLVETCSLEITGVGTEYIGAKVVSQIITENEDSSLRDPAQNYKNAGQSGAHRLQEKVVFFATSSTDEFSSAESAEGAGTTIFTLENGEILKSESATEEDSFLFETLARRTYDENGSYKVEGLTLQDRKECTENGITISVSQGKAYINGYEVTKPTSNTLTLAYATDTRTIQNEPKQFIKTVAHTTTDVATVTRGNVAGGTDELPHDNVQSIQKISSADDLTIYVQGTDYQLIGNSVDWSLGGSEPTESSSYKVEYTYYDTLDSKVLEYSINNVPVKEILRVTCAVTETARLYRGNVHGGSDALPHTSVANIRRVATADGVTYAQGVDYQLTNDSVDWSLAGEEVGIGNQYLVTYDYYKNLVPVDDYILVNGVNEQTGQYESKIRIVNPDLDIVSGRNDDIRIDYEYYLARKDLIVLDQRGIYSIYQGVSNTEKLVESPINQDDKKLVVGTVLIRAGYSGMGADSALQSVLLSTNDSVRLSQDNLYQMKNRIDTLEYNVAMSDLDQEAAEGEAATNLRGLFTDGFIGLTKADTGHDAFSCCFDLDNSEVSLPVVSNITNMVANTNTMDTTATTVGNNWMAPFEHSVVLSQVSATTTFTVDPYAVYSEMGVVHLTPAVDNWIGPTMYVNQTKTNTRTIRRWWYHKGNSWAESERLKWLQLTNTDTSSYNSASNTTGFVLDEASMYMRDIPIQVTGDNFVASANNIKCYFDDMLVSLTPTGSTVAGTEAGTVKADAKGHFTARFTVKSNTPCGKVSVRLTDGTREGTAIYTAQGRSQVIQSTTLVSKEMLTSVWPCAQSFQFDKDTILTKVGLYFYAKGSQNVTIQIRNMVNGNPGQTVYDEVTIAASDILTSTTSATETLVNLTQPVYCSAEVPYCLCIFAASTQTVLWQSVVGGKDVITKKVISSQPYMTGQLYTGWNRQTWVQYANQDLKFRLFGAAFTGETGTVVFNRATVPQMNRFVLAAQSIDFHNSGVNWFYRTKEEEDWKPFDTYVEQYPDTLATTLFVKVDIVPSNGVSPILSASNINLVSFIESPSGSYISRTVYMDNPFKVISISLEAARPTGTEFEVQYSTDNVNWTTVNDIESARTQVDEEFLRYSYKETLGAPVNTYKVRVNFTSSDLKKRPRIRKLMSILRTE